MTPQATDFQAVVSNEVQATITVCEYLGLQIIIGAKDADTLEKAVRLLTGDEYDPSRFQQVTISQL